MRKIAVILFVFLANSTLALAATGLRVNELVEEGMSAHVIQLPQRAGERELRLELSIKASQSATADAGPLPLVIYAPNGAQVSHKVVLSQPVEHFVRTLELSDKLNVVVSEGEFEPRSIGSYSLLVYAKEQVSGSEDAGLFISGVIRQREGTLERVFIDRLEPGAAPSVIVTMRSVGSGSYLSAEAFQMVDNALVLQATVTSAPAETDPVKALEASLRASRAR